MQIYDKLYIGKSAKPNEKKILRKIKHGKLQYGVYVITLPLLDNDLLEIYSANELTQKFYKKSNLKIVGIAGDYYEALELASNIILEIYEKTGRFDGRKYLK